MPSTETAIYAADAGQWSGEDFTIGCSNCGEPYVEHVTPDDDMGLVLCPVPA